jgi:predicted phage terminase large subunit-like protein
MPYTHGRVIEAICEHLEAVTSGQIRRLLINVPPGTAKSLLTGVFWPAWEWGPKGLPHLRYLGFSYAERLSIRDNRRCRLLLESPWFQERWPLPLLFDQNQKTLFENDARGWRMASSVGGVGTGARADQLLVDDPHHVADGESPAKLENALLWFREVLPTRLNDPSRSAIVVIMQRVHERDIAGEILAKGLGYEHLMLPMRYEPERHCRTSIGFADWRMQEGELLFPARFPEEVVARDERAMGSYAVAAQFQQRPAPRGGGLIRVERLPIVADWPRHARTVRVWDFAATAEGAGTDPDYTAGVKMAECQGRYWIVDVVRGRWAPAEVEAVVAQTAQHDGLATVIHLKQEPGSAGKSVVEHFMRRVLRGYAVYAARDSGSKLLRAQPFAAAVEAGNVSLVQGGWNEAFLDEARVFPAGAHDDQIDAAADAWLRLSQAPLIYVA